jgi:hypothetical protein
MCHQTINCVNLSYKLSKQCQRPTQGQQKDKNKLNFFLIKQKCPYKFEKSKK